jgi:hypothetical protein
MLESADYAVLFRAAESIKEIFPKMPSVEDYDDLYEHFVGYLRDNP